MSKFVITNFNVNEEMRRLYDDPEDEESSKIFSTIEIEEYWDNLRENAIDETDTLVQSTKPNFAKYYSSFSANKIRKTQRGE